MHSAETIAQRLNEAQERAEELFEAIERRGVLEPGILESEASRRIHALAHELFGITTWWHRRVVRAGVNTVHPYNEHPDDLLIADGDICFVDLGPVFEGWEADFGKTYVLGDDARKLQLRDDVEEAFRRGREWFTERPECTGQQLYAFMNDTARELGWTFGGEHCGHLIGEFPHEKIADEKVFSYIHPRNDRPMRGHLPDGTRCFWILESHLVDREARMGGFYEALLNA